MNGPTMRRLTCGSARRTAKCPTSTLRGTTTRSMASAARTSPSAGSLAGKKLMIYSPSPIFSPRRREKQYVVIPMEVGWTRLRDVERFRSGRLAGGVEPNFLQPRLGQAQPLLAATLERLAALVDRDR